MISAFGIDHGDHVAKAAPAYVKGLLRAGKSSDKPYVKAVMESQRAGNQRFGGTVARGRNFGSSMSQASVKAWTGGAGRPGQLARASAARGSKAGAALKRPEMQSARTKFARLKATNSAKNTRVLP